MHTAQELAEIFGKADNLDTEAVRVLARRIRHFDSERLIIASEAKRDARGTAQFNTVEACKARILSVLADYGFGGQLLREVARAIEPAPSGVVIGRGGERPYWNDDPEQVIPPENHIAHLPAATLRGEKWILVLRLNSQHGRKSLSGFLIPSEKQAGGLNSDWRAFHEIELIGELRVPVAELIRPLLGVTE